MVKRQEDQPALSDPTFFTPRPWLENKVDEWLEGDSGSRVLLISGGPGTGKSRLLHALSLKLAASSGPATATLCTAILRDLRANQSDEMSWNLLKEGLLEAALGTSALVGAASSTVTVNVESMASGASAIGYQVVNQYLLTADPASDLRETVLPRLASLPSGPPLVVIVDGLDEAVRDNAESFLAVVAALADAIARAPYRDRGVGRLRLLMASQPEVPIDLNPLHQPVRINLNQQHEDDKRALTEYVTTLLAGLPDEHRHRLAGNVAASAHGVWVWAFYVAAAIAEDVAAGQPPPSVVNAPAALTGVYQEALQRAEKRLAAQWQSGADLLALVAAAQDVRASLPHDIGMAALNLDSANLARLVNELRALILDHGDDGFGFFHGDFGRWLADGGYAYANVRDAHDRLAALAMSLGQTQGWQNAGQYARTYAIPHALAVAELDLGTVRFAPSHERCVHFFGEPGVYDLLRTDAGSPLRRLWLAYVRRLEDISPAQTHIKRSGPLPGLSNSLFEELETNVGFELATHMSAGDLDAFMERVRDEDEAGALNWVQTNRPDYETVVARQLWALWARTLEEGRPRVDIRGLARMANLHYQRWRRGHDPGELDLAIDDDRRVIELSPESPELTTMMVSYATHLGERVNSGHERPDDLDRLVTIRRTLVSRPDLLEPAVTNEMYAYWVRRLWDRSPDPVHAHHLDGAVEASLRALQLSSDTDPDYSDRLIRLVGSYMQRIDTDREKPDDLDDLIRYQRQLLDRPDLDDPATNLWIYSQWLGRRWQRHPEAANYDDLDDAVRAAEDALRLAGDEHPHRTDLLFLVANGYIRRIGTVREQPTDVDRLVAAQAEVVGRADLANPANANSVLGYWCLERHRRRANRDLHDDLDQAVHAYRRSIELATTDASHRTERLAGLATAYANRVGGPGERPEDLDRLLAAQTDLLSQPDLATVTDEAMAYRSHARWLGYRWERFPDPDHYDDLDRAVEAARVAADLVSDDAEGRTECLVALAKAYARRVGTAREQPEDDERVVTLRAELATRPDLVEVSSGRRGRPEASADGPAADDRTRAELAYELTDGTERVRPLRDLVNAYARRIGTDDAQPGDLDDLLLHQTLLLDRPDVGDHATANGISAFWFGQRWRLHPEDHVEDLDRSVEAAERAVTLAGDDHPRRTELLRGLANAFARRVGTAREQPDDLDRVIRTQTELLARPDIDEPSNAFGVLAYWLAQRWSRDPGPERYDDLDAAVHAYQQAVHLGPEDHSRRTGYLLGLATSYSRRVGTPREQPDDLDNLLAAQAEALNAADLDDSAGAHGFYGTWLGRRWLRHRDPDHHEDLDRAVQALRIALDMVSEANRSRYLAALVDAIANRVDSEVERPDDLDTLISYQEELVGRPDADAVGANAVLGNWLGLRWERQHSFESEDADRAVDAHTRAVDLCPVDDARREQVLRGLANALDARMVRTSSRPEIELPDDLDRLIEVHRELVGLLSGEDAAMNQSGLANALRRRWRRNGGADEYRADLVDAIAAATTAMDLVPPQSPRTTAYRAQLSNLLLIGHVNAIDGARLDRAVELARGARRPDGSLAEELSEALRRLVRRAEAKGVS